MVSRHPRAGTRWTSRGAQFITPPKALGSEIRCHVRDPDGHTLELAYGQEVALAVEKGHA